MKIVYQFTELSFSHLPSLSPLVLFTALQSSFEADPSSSEYVTKPAPTINQHGAYEFNHKGRNIRVYTRIDTQLIFNDFFAKLELMNKQ